MNNRAAPIVARSQTSVIAPGEGARVSSDNPLAAFVAFLAEDTSVGERSARLYVAHLQRFAGWLEQRYQARLLDGTTRDLREYRAQLAGRLKPASVNAALAALRCFLRLGCGYRSHGEEPGAALVDSRRSSSRQRGSPTSSAAGCAAKRNRPARWPKRL